MPVEDVQRRKALEEIVPGCPLDLRFGLEPEAAMRKAQEAARKLDLLADAELSDGLFENEVLAMLFADAARRAGYIYAKAKEELETLQER